MNAQEVILALALEIAELRIERDQAREEVRQLKLMVVPADTVVEENGSG